MEKGITKRHFSKAFSIVCCAILCTIFVLCTNCASAEEARGSASTEEQFLELVEQMREEQAENREEVIESIYKDGATLLSDWPEDAEEQTDAGEQTGAEEQTDAEEVNAEEALETRKWRYDMEQAYQANQLKPFLITESRKNGFESCITDELIWKVPYKTPGGGHGLALFLKDKESGKFVYGGSSIHDSSEPYEAIPPSPEVVAENFGRTVTEEKIQKIQYTYSGMYSTMIYIVTEKEEYIIPYVENEGVYQRVNKRSKLYNGKVYTMSKFMKEMNRLFDEKPFLEGKYKDLVGPSMPYREGIYFESWMAAAIAGGIVIVVAILVVIKKTGFFRRKKDSLRAGGSEEEDSPWARPSEEEDSPWARPSEKEDSP